MRQVLLRTGLSLLLLIMCSTASAITLKIATVAPDGTTWMKELRKGAAEIKKKTQGRVKFKFYPGGVMGSSKSVLRKIRIRQLHGGAFTGSEMAQVYPDIQIYSLPFMFNSHDEIDAVRKKTDQLLKAGLKKKGYVALGLSEGGFAYLMSQKSLASIDDVRGQKVWVPEGDQLTREVLSTAEIKPVPLPISDVYTGISTGLVDSVTNTPMGAIAFQWHTHLTHVTDLPLAYLIGILVVEEKTFKKIKSPDRKIVHEIMGGIFKRLDNINRKDNLEARQALKNQGMEFIRINKGEIKRWQDIGKNATEVLLQKKMISKGLYDRVAKHLRDYRNNH